jgi:hypothetical protein
MKKRGFAWQPTGAFVPGDSEGRDGLIAPIATAIKLPSAPFQADNGQDAATARILRPGLHGHLCGLKVQPTLPRG